MNPSIFFDQDCRKCDRLATFLDEVKIRHPDYYARPVPAFGDADAHLLIVGLAPGMHGANATGRPFTGDHAGLLLYQTLYDHGFASAAESTDINDGLQLINCRITNAVKCLPPENKPIGAEVKNCNQFLKTELSALPVDSIIVALGGVAHRAVITALELKQKDHAFAHLAEFQLPGGQILIDSYHCSRYNTQTRRLTPQMFSAVFERARCLITNHS